MAFDANREDYQRLGLRFVNELDCADPTAAARAFAGFGHTFSTDRDSLPQSDEDRAFHLVAVATGMIDYELPFVDDEQAIELIPKAHAVLDEAVQLDPKCHDALRMRAAADIASFEGFVDYLRNGAEQVRIDCEQRRDAILRVMGTERGELAAELAMRPYIRWVSMQATKAVICGRNREALALSTKAFSLGPNDPADARFTAAIAYAKLEDEAGLDRLAARTRAFSLARAHDPEDPWMQIARMALAFKAHNIARAREQLKALCSSYPRAAVALAVQRELPDGVFARLSVKPFGEDEIILAVSEATVLMQEGFDRSGRGAFGAWLAREAEALVPAWDKVELEARRAMAPRPQSPFGGEA